MAQHHAICPSGNVRHCWNNAYNAKYIMRPRKYRQHQRTQMLIQGKHHRQTRTRWDRRIFSLSHKIQPRWVVSLLHDFLWLSCHLEVRERGGFNDKSPASEKFAAVTSYTIQICNLGQMWHFTTTGSKPLVAWCNKYLEPIHMGMFFWWNGLYIFSVYSYHFRISSIFTNLCWP